MKRKSSFYVLSPKKIGPLSAAAGPEMNSGSFQLITVQNILVIGFERQGKSEANLVLEVIIP